MTLRTITLSTFCRGDPMIETRRVSIQDAKIEGAVVCVIKAWATAYPLELTQFDRQMKSERGAMTHEGKTSGGTMRKFGDIPASLDRFMVKCFGNMWHYDLRLRRYFWRNFIVGKFKRWSTLGQPSAARSL